MRLSLRFIARSTWALLDRHCSRLRNGTFRGSRGVCAAHLAGPAAIPIDGFYGRATRDAVARYQTEHHLTITGTLTTQTLQSLGVAPSVAS